MLGVRLSRVSWGRGADVVLYPIEYNGRRPISWEAQQQGLHHSELNNVTQDIIPSLWVGIRMDVPHASTDVEQTRALLALIQELQQRSQPQLPLPPKPVPRAVKWLTGLMPTFIAIFGLGSQITFTVIPTITNDDAVPSGWGAAEVRTFLSLAWMFFTLGFGLSCAMALTPAYYGGDDLGERLGSKRHEKIVNSLCALLQLFAALAFLFLALVVVAYTPAVGWVVVGTGCLCVLVALVTYVIDTWL